MLSKQQILNTLKQNCGNKSIRLSRDIDFSLTQGILTIKIIKEYTYENMQVDGAAFEGWAIVLKRWLKEIKMVKFEWEVPELADSSNETQHYQRLLFRMIKFTETYSWAKVAKCNQHCLKQSRIYNGEKNVLNVPSKPRTRKFTNKPLNELTENELEKNILSDTTIYDSFKKEFDLKFADNQLPVGVFNIEISNSTKIFTGGKSAIDIWGISNDGKSCYLFELKDDNNRKVGALSEMLFYSYVIQDVINGKMDFHSLKYPGLKEITEAQEVKCFLLALNTHPLIDNEVFQLLNDLSSGSEFANALITDNLSFKVL